MKCLKKKVVCNDVPSQKLCIMLCVTKNKPVVLSDVHKQKDYVMTYITKKVVHNNVHSQKKLCITMYVTKNNCE